MKIGKPKFNARKGLTDSLIKTRDDVVSGKALDATNSNPANLGKDISTAAKTAGGSIKNAVNTSIGDPAANAWHTSVLDPTNKAVNQAKEMASKWGGKAEDWYNKMQTSGNTGLNIPKVGQGGIGAGGGMAGPGGPVQIQALNGQGGSANVADNEFRTGQLTLAQQLAAQAAGQGPSLATEQLKQAQNTNQAAIFAQLASQRGGANPALARQAMQTSAQIQGQTARDAALARIQEQMGARDQLGNVLGSGRTGDIQTAGQQNELAIQQAQLGQQNEELKQKYAAMGLDAEKANQMAALEMERILSGQANTNPAMDMVKALSQTFGTIMS